MSWQESIRQPSINGILFEMTDGSVAGGNKLQDGKEQKKVTKPGVLNNGPKIRTFTINGFVTGDDYLSRAGQIERELKKEAQARLVHPTYGALKVLIDGYSININPAVGRKISFSFTCWESGVIEYPRSKVDKIGKATKTKEEIELIIKDEFVENFSVAGRPQFVKDSGVSLIEEASTTFDDMTSGITGISDSVGEGTFESKKLFSDAKDLVEKPLDLAERLNYSMNLAKNFAKEPKDLFSSYRKTDSYGSAKIIVAPITKTRIQESENKKQMIQIIKTNGLASSIVQAITMSEKRLLTNSGEAESIRDELLASIDDAMNTSTNDELFIKLQNMRTQVINAIPGESSSLPNIISLNVERTTNSLALAYELTGSLDTELEIINRNGISHPGFITPQNIEVVK